VTDVQEEIREMLHHKAQEVPAHLDVPPSLSRRVAPRIARNALLVVGSLVVIAFVATAGFRTLNGPPEPAPNTGGPDPSVSSTTTCSADALRVIPALEGAAGSREGAIVLRNTSGDTCDLAGTPDVTMVDAGGRSLPVEIQPTLPTWKVNRSTRPDGWPTVTLAPGSTASVRLRWSNWCDTSVTTPVMVLTTGGAEVARIEFDAATIPPCNGQDVPSTIEIGPFEPSD
jgi:hypothetical protein